MEIGASHINTDYDAGQRTSASLPYTSSTEADSVSLGSPKEKEWTLLFYNAGYGCESKMSTANLLDLERRGSDENTNVVVMNYRSPWFLERFTGKNSQFLGTSTYYVTKQASYAPPLSGLLPSNARSLAEFLATSPKSIGSEVIEKHPGTVNMGEKETLERFLIDNMKRYPARNYAVIMSGHGAAFGGSMIVHNPEGRIRNEELASVLKNVENETGHRIDLLNMNTCFSANIESVYPLRSGVKTMVASESTVFGATQPFSKVLADLQGALKEGRKISARELAALFVEESHRQPLGSVYTETMSAFDMEKVGKVADSINGLQKILMNEGVDPGVIARAMKESARLSYSSIPRETSLTDIGSFADKITELTGSERVREKASELKDSLKECVFAEKHARNHNEGLLERALHNVTGELQKGSDYSGLSVYYDEDALDPDSRLDQIVKTDYSRDVNAAEFLKYVSRDAESKKQERSFIQRTRDGLGRKHSDLLQSLSKKSGIHQSFLSLGERLGIGVGMMTAFRLLGAAGIPVYPICFGTLFSVKGIVNAFNGFVDATKANNDKIGETDRKEAIVNNIGKGALGLAMSTFGLYLLGILPGAVAWPAAIAAVAIRGGKELAKLILSRDEIKTFREEARRFSEMSIGEKIGSIGIK